MSKPRIGDRVTIHDPDMEDEDHMDVPVISMGNGEDFIIRTRDGRELAYNLAENITVTILADESEEEDTGEPPGAGEDVFERAMARAYPVRRDREISDMFKGWGR